MPANNVTIPLSVLDRVYRELKRRGCMTKREVTKMMGYAATSKDTALMRLESQGYLVYEEGNQVYPFEKDC